MDFLFSSVQLHYAINRNYLPNNIYHYVAGTGYNNNQPEDRICYYNDPNAGRPDAYGEQEIGFRLMCTLMKDRGLVF